MSAVPALPNEIRLTHEATTLTLALHGSVTVMIATELHQAARTFAAHEGPARLDLSAAERLDCAAAQILVAAGAARRDAGRDLALVDAPESTMRALRLAGLLAPLGLTASV